MICSYWGQQAEVQVVLVFRHSAPPPRSSKTLTLTGFQGSNINLTRDDIDLKSGSGVQGGGAVDTGCDVAVDKDFEAGEGKGVVRLQIGDGSNADTNAIYVDLGFDIGDFFADVTDIDKSLETVERVDEVVSLVRAKEGEIGAVMSRLEAVMDVQASQIENNMAALSVVRDADIAQETVNYIKAQISGQTALSLSAATKNLYSQILLSLVSNV